MTQAHRINLEKAPAYHRALCTAPVVGERPEIEHPQGKKQLLYGKTSLRVRKSTLRDLLHTLHSTERNKYLIIVDGTICKFYFTTCACLPLGTR